VKIIYDISVLGRGYLDDRSRTGVFRVIESVFAEIIKYEDLAIIPTSLNSQNDLWDNFSAQLYLEDNYPQTLSSYLDVYPYNFPFQEVRTSIQKYLIKDSKKNRKLTARALRFGLAKACRFFDYAVNLDIKNIEKKTIETSLGGLGDVTDAVYHSPFLALPAISDLPSNIPRIVTIYDLIPIKFPEFFMSEQVSLIEWVLRSIDPKKDWVLCISENTRNDFLEFFKGRFDSSRALVTPLAAAEKFRPLEDLGLIESVKSKYGIPGQIPYFLSLCTLEPRKNLSSVIKAFSRLIDEGKADLNLVLVGTHGWKNKSIFEELKKSSRLSSRVFLLGYVPDQDLSAIYSGAIGFVYPSFYEGFGLPPLEAMQCGVPVITSSVSSLPEVVGDAGIMVDPNSLDEICQAMQKVAKNDTLRQTMSRKSLERAKQFSWSLCAQKTVEAYKSAISSK
jgi:glycosyltransferase involved in cell wall biosynthesis